MGSFLLLGIVALAGLLLMYGLTFPSCTHRTPDKKVRQAWYRIVARPAYLTALFSASTGFGIMVLAMTATPLAMQHYSYSLMQSTTVIHTAGLPELVAAQFKNKKSAKEQRRLVQSNASNFGNDWIILPNSAYGSWSKATLDSWKVSTPQ